MSLDYWIAWIALYICGLIFIALCVYPIRRHVYWSLFVGGMGILWMLVPIPFIEDFSAPLYIVLLFQLFIEPDVSYAFSATTAIVGSATVIVAVLVIYILNLTLGKKALNRLFRQDN